MGLTIRIRCKAPEVDFRALEEVALLVLSLTEAVAESKDLEADFECSDSVSWSTLQVL